MCTFKITNYDHALSIDKFLKLGGPTLSKNLSIDNIQFTHNLLSITGEITPQPIIKGDYLYMLLGEIYNYNKTYSSDIYSAIENYELYGDSFTNYLDGEFLIIVYDLKNKIINFYTDPWSTKMAWFDTFDNYFYFGTFKLSNNSKRLLHNSHYSFNVDTKSLNCINPQLHNWDLNQFKVNYDDWTNAFIDSVKKRFHKETVLALSGGLDSIAIAACLADLKLTFESCILLFKNKEDIESIKSIITYIKPICNNIHVLNNKEYLNTSSESFNFLYEKKLEYYPLGFICFLMNKLNKKVLLTGQGSDEIFDNYIYKFSSKNKFLKMSRWPEDLSNVFPYDHFYENRQRKLIDMHQYVSLSYGIETRNPFLDKKLAQEWLWISSDLKNKESKGPIKKFLLDRGLLVSYKIAGLGDQSIEAGKSLESITL